MAAILIAALITCILAVVYIAAVAYEAKHSTDNAPRQDMFTCEKHGLFPKKYAMQLTGITEEPILQCPFCFETRMKEARKNVK
jgi:hypothetical protein